jgi:hypothetical protein
MGQFNVGFSTLIVLPVSNELLCVDIRQLTIPVPQGDFTAKRHKVWRSQMP